MSRVAPNPLPESSPNARHRVRERLQHMIHSGQIKPGQKLVQRKLAAQFNVSKSLVREALLELRGLGMIDEIDKRGMFVGEQSRRRLIESYDVRAVLEGLAVRLCCDHITRAQIRELEQMADRMYELGMAERRDEASALDRAFHLNLVEISGNRVLINLMAQDRFLGKVAWLKTDPALTREHHLVVLNAIAENRPDDAERILRDLIREGKRRVEEFFASGEELPRWVPL